MGRTFSCNVVFLHCGTDTFTSVVEEIFHFIDLLLVFSNGISDSLLDLMGSMCIITLIDKIF